MSQMYEYTVISILCKRARVRTRDNEQLESLIHTLWPICVDLTTITLSNE